MEMEHDTDKPEEVRDVSKTSEKAERESTISDDSKQTDWGKAREISHEHDIHPSEVEGLEVVDPFGIDLGDGEILTAKGVEQKCAADRIRESAISSTEMQPPVSASRMMRIAEEEHDHPTRWKGWPPKCNYFLDKVMHDSGMPMPWKAGLPPRSWEMNLLLDQNKSFTKVWNTDFSDVEVAHRRFATFEMKPGDLVVWDVPDEVVKGGISHSAIATGSRKIIYAGSQVPGNNGCGHCDVRAFTGTVENPTQYRAPTVIYRYKNMTK